MCVGEGEIACTRAYVYACVCMPVCMPVPGPVCACVCVCVHLFEQPKQHVGGESPLVSFV